MRSLFRYTATVLLAAVLLVTWGARADAQLSPSLRFSPATAPAGSTITIDGTAFQPGEVVNVNYGGRTIAQAIADSSGRFTARGTIDAQMPIGTHPLDANGSMGSFVNTGYTVSAAAPQVPGQPVPAPAPAPAVPAPTPAPATPGRPGTVIVTPPSDTAIVVPPVADPSTSPDDEVAVEATQAHQGSGDAADADDATAGRTVADAESGAGLLDRLSSSWALAGLVAAFAVCLLVAFVRRRAQRARLDGEVPLATA